jgi:fibronectin-binding autotransporter adhesin
MEGTTVAGNALMTGTARRAAGGGLYLSNSSLVATDLVVDNNAADGFQDSSGGGIWTASSAGVRLDLERVAITRNTVATGPASGEVGTVNSGAALMVSSVSGGVGSPQPLPLRLRLVTTAIAANTASAATVSDPPVVVVGAGAPGDTVMSHLSVIGNTGGQHLLRVDLSSEEGAPGVIASSLFADNTPATCTGFGLRSGGGNLFSTSGCAFEDATDDVTGVDPLLGELGDHGGSTLTVPLLPGSPAIDAADCIAIAGVFMAVDQRGAARNALCDVGAYELSSP